MKKILLYPLNKITLNTFNHKNLLSEKCIGILDFNSNDNKLLEICESNIVTSYYKELDFDKLYIYDNIIGDIHIREIYQNNNVKEKVINLIRFCNSNNKEVIITIYSEELATIVDENKLVVTYQLTEEEEYTDIKKYKKYKNNALNIGVFSTDSCSGKFTTQMLLKQQLEKIGKTEVILTEPNGFQLSKYYAPVNDYLTYTQFIDYCKLLKNKTYFTEKNEFTIFAGQSGISNKNKDSPVYFELQSLSLLYLLASESDIIYLVYKPYDLKNLKKSIDIINAFCDVIEIIIVIPNKYEMNHMTEKQLNKYDPITKNDLIKIRESIHDNIGEYNVVSIDELDKTIPMVKDAQSLKYVFSDGKINSYSKKNKYIILKYIINKFEYSRIYSEIDVNRIIKENISFNDHVLIRRELIENKMLERNDNGSIYKRI